MFVQYLGGGIWHKATNEYTQKLRPKYYILQQQQVDPDNDTDLDEPEDEEVEEEEAPKGENGLGNGLEDKANKEESSSKLEEENEYKKENSKELWEVDNTEALGYGEY